MPAANRRAFAMPIVLFLCLISSLFLVAALERRANQRLSVQRQITEYRRHHEMFGVRAIARKWLEKSFDQLPQIVEKQAKARKGEDDFAYGFVLPSGAQIRVYVRDGQGAALSDTSLVSSAQSHDYEMFLSRLTSDRPNLRRRVGQPAVSINAAPREVLAALLEDNGDSFADKVLAARRRKPIDRDTLESLLRGIGTDDQERNRVSSLITLEPSLWRLDIEVTDEQGQRLFTMLTERPRGKIEVYEWLELAPEQDDQPGDQPKSDHAPRKPRK